MYNVFSFGVRHKTSRFVIVALAGFQFRILREKLKLLCEKKRKEKEIILLNLIIT
jgi:hypothetical protein